MVIGKFKHNPVIVIGMHRSGTTLLSRLLQELNVHMGADRCRETNESFSFMRLNDSLLHKANANWHKTFPIWEVLNDDRQVDLLASQLRDQFSDGSLNDYWWEGWPRIESERIWGWKDPRNTLILPIWRRIFPKAKIINVVRNGIDVAQSLIKRSQNESDSRFSFAVKNRVVQLLNQHRSKSTEYCTDPNPSITVEKAFRLWTEYLRFADFNTEEIPEEHILLIRYEDLLIEPLSSLRLIANFVGSGIEDNALTEVAEFVNNDRRFAFATDPELCEFYRSNREHHQMAKYAYDQLLDREANSIVN